MSELPEGDLESERHRLQLEKLRLDIKYAPRVFFAQLANTFVVACLTIAVLYLFQRPQLEHLRQTQASAEKQQAMSLLIAAQGISDEKDRLRIVQALSASWPENALLKSFASSNDVLVRLSHFEHVGTVTQDCGTMDADAERLDNEILSLQTAEANEIGLGETGRPAGIGPLAKLLAVQRERLVSKRAHLSAQANAFGCVIRKGL